MRSCAVRSFKTIFNFVNDDDDVSVLIWDFSVFFSTFLLYSKISINQNELRNSVINGEFRQYRGSRDADTLMSYIEDQKWKEYEPVSAWKHPDSVQMAIVSYFFKLSHYLKVRSRRQAPAHTLLFDILSGQKWNSNWCVLYHYTLAGSQQCDACRLWHATMAHLCSICHYNHFVGRIVGPNFSVNYRFNFPARIAK